MSVPYAQPYPLAHETDEPGDHKDRFRAAARDARRHRSARRLTQAGTGLAHVVQLICQALDAKTVAAYASRPGEPPTDEVLTTLCDSGRRVLLPVLGERLARQWAVYEPDTELQVRAPGRPPEPLGPSLDAEAITEADVVLVPALAIDTAGRRIGQGAGWYDRVLPLLRSDAMSVGVVFEPELYDAQTRPLPEEPHDARVRAVATPQRWQLTDLRDQL